MTVLAQTNRVAYVATAGQTIFPVPFPLLAPEHLYVYRQGLLLSTPAQYLVAQGVSVDGPTSWSAVLLTPTAADDQVLLLRLLPYDQQVTFPEGDPFPARVQEHGLDKLTCLTQQLQEGLERAPHFAITSNTRDVIFPEPSPQGFLAWDETGTGLTTQLPPAFTLTALPEHTHDVPVHTHEAGAHTHPPSWPSLSGVVLTADLNPQGAGRLQGTWTDAVATDSTGLDAGRFVLLARGDEAGGAGAGSANEWLAFLSLELLPTSSLSHYEKAALFIRTISSDPFELRRRVRCAGDLPRCGRHGSANPPRAGQHAGPRLGREPRRQRPGRQRWHSDRPGDRPVE